MVYVTNSQSSITITRLKARVANNSPDPVFTFRAAVHQNGYNVYYPEVVEYYPSCINTSEGSIPVESVEYYKSPSYFAGTYSKPVSFDLGTAWGEDFFVTTIGLFHSGTLNPTLY